MRAVLYSLVACHKHVLVTKLSLRRPHNTAESALRIIIANLSMLRLMVARTIFELLEHRTAKWGKLNAR